MNSNASGVIILLELLRVFSKLYRNMKTSPKYNLIFLLSAGGKLNYQGTRQWIDNYFERYDSHSNVGSKVHYALCLDSLAKSSQLFMHVSKVPKNESYLANFHQQLVGAAELFNRSVVIVQKKINLAEDFLAWEHERFNIRKIYATTLSTSKTHKDITSRSILDLNKSEYADVLSKNINIISEGLFRYLFGMSDLVSERFIQGEESIVPHVKMWLRYFSTTPRSAQVFVGSQDNSFLNDMLAYMETFASEAALMPVAADKKDPEFVLFEGVEDVIFAYSIKPALFDLVLAVIVAGYVFSVYFTVVNISVVQQRVRRILKLRHEKLR
ncbi:unnamed protein product [Soboliphyme baturini]|uniref:BOS complex subunit NCLN n=1 Tax=Soboliphyme baturini TaxID=241478 RepID=A0A183ISQ0_9BILA|nr:unnamed protein product [Soboliphyme baturini]